MRDEHFEEYIDLCMRMYERMRRDGTWPWDDSTNYESEVDSDD